MKKIFLILLIFTGERTLAQSQNDSLNSVIHYFFDCMQKNDIRGFDKIMDTQTELKTVMNFKDSVRVYSMKYSEFQSMMNEPLHGDWEERLIHYNYLIDEWMATVWTEYEFYFDGKLRHTGVNQFTMMRNKSGKDFAWKIISLIDTRYPGGKNDLNYSRKKSEETEKLNQLTNEWHLAAATANESDFFKSMSDSCIYKGTDKSERWTKSEFYQFAKPFFDKGKAWNFKPLDRHIRFDDNLEIAWFDERLDTWMGECKASGIWKKENGEWKLWLYDLSVTIDNDKIKKFIKLTTK